MDTRLALGPHTSQSRSVHLVGGRLAGRVDHVPTRAHVDHRWQALQFYVGLRRVALARNLVLLFGSLLGESFMK